MKIEKHETSNETRKEKKMENTIQQHMSESDRIKAAVKNVQFGVDSDEIYDIISMITAEILGAISSAGGFKEIKTSDDVHATVASYHIDVFMLVCKYMPEKHTDAEYEEELENLMCKEVEDSLVEELYAYCD